MLSDWHKIGRDLTCCFNFSCVWRVMCSQSEPMATWNYCVCFVCEPARQSRSIRIPWCIVCKVSNLLRLHRLNGNVCARAKQGADRIGLSLWIALVDLLFIIWDNHFTKLHAAVFVAWVTFTCGKCINKHDLSFLFKLIAPTKLCEI